MTNKGDTTSDKEEAFAFDMPDSAEKPLKDRIADDRNIFERLLTKVPGFKTLVDNNDWREADQLLRNTLADKLDQSRLTLAGVHQKLSADISLAIVYAEPLGRVNTKLTGLIGKLRAAPVGYSGYFSAVKIDQEKLEEIYAFDDNFFDQVDLIDATVRELAKTVDLDRDISKAINDTFDVVTNASSLFEERKTILSGINS